MIKAKVESAKFKSARLSHLIFYSPRILNKLEKCKQIFELMRDSKGASFPLKDYKNMVTVKSKDSQAFFKWNKIQFRSLRMCFADYVVMLETLIQYNNVIIAGKPAALEILIKDFDVFSKGYIEKTTKGVERWAIGFEKTFIHALNKIYDYDGFSDGYKDWGAYHLADMLNVKVCLYCNRAYTFTVFHRKEPIVRHEFDHFYCQQWFPFLAISFYNLIPSCHTCNSTLKGSKRLKIGTFMHPYLEGYEDVYKFRTGYDLNKFLNHGNRIRSNLSLMLQPSFVTKGNDVRANENIELFHLRTIYKHHKDIAENIFNVSQRYTPATLQGLMTIKGAKPLIKNRFDLYRTVFNNYWKPEDFGNAPLAKFTRDISEETGLLETIYKIMTS